MLPEQTWDQYVGELFDSQLIHNDYTQQHIEVDVNHGSLKYTHDQIEQWATGDPIEGGTRVEHSHEDIFMCYGMVCYIQSALNLRENMTFHHFD